MSDFEWDTGAFIAHLKNVETKVLAREEEALHDVTDDLLRISTNIAPIEEGDLRRSGKKKVKAEEGKFMGEVRFAVRRKKSNGSFNYAYKIHEGNYSLGPESASAGGTDGYSVGNKFLQRPLEGESRRYVQILSEAIGKGLEG